jgi:hypothetical protein
MSAPAAAASTADAEEDGPSQQSGGRWSKSISEKDTVLAIQVAAWLRKRGKVCMVLLQGCSAMSWALAGEIVQAVPVAAAMFCCTAKHV